MLRWLEVERRETECRPSPGGDREASERLRVSILLLLVSCRAFAYPAVEMPSPTTETPTSEVH